MAGLLEGKTVLVTGGNSGIGRASVFAFAREGARVAIAARRAREGEETARAVQDSGGDAIFVQTDVANGADIKGLVEKTVQHYGRLDCAFNNAGTAGAFGSTADCTEENWDTVMAINLKGMWLCMKHEILQMLKQGGGVIVNNSSTLGLKGAPYYPAYSASKYGIHGLTKTAALEYGRRGIRVNAVCPSGTVTSMLEGQRREQEQYGESRKDSVYVMGRMPSPEDSAEAAVWLCTDRASSINGHILVVDGGQMAGIPPVRD